jgi:ribose transport system permease protein
MLAASLAGIALCGGAGAVSGSLVAVFGIPPFIATLAMMLVASGAAFVLSRGESIYQVPESFTWLGRATAFGLPNAVLLTLLLYSVAHVLLSWTVLGRHIYAVGNNPQAARFSGISLRNVRLTVYTLCGAMAGVGGVVIASQLQSGAPTYGVMYELYAIAAVVVGGTSLHGGRGGVAGTLVGALIIAVIQNGMNLTGVESYTQKIVLGLVILAAVLLDRLTRGPGSTTADE